MLIIYDRQIKALEDHLKERFVLQMTEKAGLFDAKSLLIDVTQESIRKIVNEALRYDLQSDTVIEKYIELKLHYTQMNTVPMSSDVLEILTFPERTEDIKINELIALLV